MKNLIRTIALALFGFFSLLFGQAFAAVPAEVTTALADAKTDSTAIAATAFTIVIAILAFTYMRKGAH
jgi:hypothetical protein